MPVYNKLKIAIFAIIASPSVSALTLEPIEILSGSGNLLYAEMKFYNADPNAKVEASLAETQDLINLGLAHQPPSHLNFFTRKSHDGTGVIVITSSRPMVETELNILLKIKEGSATHIQQVKKNLKRPNSSAKVPLSTRENTLRPQTVVSEKDIALNLPSSTQYVAQTAIVQSTSLASSTSQASRSNKVAPTVEMPLVINVAPLPSLNQNNQAIVATNMPQMASVAAPSQVSTTPVPLKVVAVPQPVGSTAVVPATQPRLQIAAKLDAPLKAESIQPKELQAAAKAAQAPETSISNKAVDDLHNQPNSAVKKAAVQVEPKTPAAMPWVKTPPASQHHIVQANESLWKIAANISAQTQQSIPDVMKKIKADNAHAFIGGNANRIRKGVELNLASSYDPKAKPPSKTTSSQSMIAQRQSGKAKYKIDQAEMSLITTSQQESAQGAAQQKQQKNQSSSELSTKVMTAREKTVKLQKNVSKLSLALQHKDQRIQLLNARLAQLQQQLQRQQAQAKKPAH